MMPESRVRDNPFRVVEFDGTFTQRSRCASTLGWMIESRWDSTAAAVWQKRSGAFFNRPASAVEAVLVVVLEVLEAQATLLIPLIYRAPNHFLTFPSSIIASH
jgi:hypothetical protein